MYKNGKCRQHISISLFTKTEEQKTKKKQKKKTWKNVNNEKSERAPRRTKDSHRYNGRYRYKYSYNFGQRCCGRSEHARRGPIIAKSRRKNARDEAINCFECSLMQFAGDPLLSLSFSPPPRGTLLQPPSLFLSRTNCASFSRFGARQQQQTTRTTTRATAFRLVDLFLA